MILLNYTLTSFDDLLQEMASRFGTELRDYKLSIPEQYGQGYFKAIRINEGIEAMVYDFRLNQDLIMRRERTTAESYILVLDEIDQPSGGSVSINREQAVEIETRDTVIYLSSFLFDVENVLHKEVKIRGARILLTIPWMQEFLQLKSKEEVLSKYISLKTAGVWYMPVDPELKELLDYLLLTSNEPRLFYQNKLLRIIEKFFNWLYNEMQSGLSGSGISRHDIEAAQKVEGIITKDITALPPTIRELAREVAMSESKLKKIFKTVYGLPPYEYFQKHRMQKARIMLLSGNHSIKDVGYTLGYSNLSNFTLAFKKEFKRLPSDIIREIR